MSIASLLYERARAIRHRIRERVATVLALQAFAHRHMARRRVAAVAEMLEARRLLSTTNTWMNAAGGDWDTAANWSLNRAPQAGDAAVINIAVSAAITKSTNTVDTFDSLTSNQPIVLSGGTMDITGTFAENTNTVTLSGGTLQGAIFVETNGASMVGSSIGGTLDGVTVNGELDLSQANNTTLTILDGLTLDGTMHIGGVRMGNIAVIKFGGAGMAAGSITGSGSVVLGGNGSNAIYNESNLTGASGVLTVGSSIAVDGGSAIIQCVDNTGSILNDGTISANALGSSITLNGTGTFVNAGTIEATSAGVLTVTNLTGNIGTAILSGQGSQIILGGSNYVNNLGISATAGSTLTLNGTWTNASGQSITASGATLNLGDQASGSPNAWNNLGTISVTNSVVNLGGDFTMAELGTFNRIGGTVTLIGVLNNTGTTLTLTSSTGMWCLGTGTILGGAISDGTVAAGGEVLEVGDTGGTLNGVTINGDVDLSQVGYATLTILNGLTLNGTMYIGGGGYATVAFGGVGLAAGSITGNGTVVFGNNNGDTINNKSNVIGAGGTLTIASSILIHGNTGNIECTSSDGGILNEGLINGDQKGNGIGIGGYGTFTNSGTIEATNGGGLAAEITGNVGTATLSGSGSSLFLNGTNYINNLGLSAPAGSTLSLAGTWLNPSGQSITAISATLNLGDQPSINDNTWNNAGTITATSSTVNLGGDFTVADLGTFNRIGGIVNVTGILHNTASTLTLNSSTGQWNLGNGSILGGTIDDGTLAGGGAVLTITGSDATLNGLTVNGDLDLGQNGTPNVYISNGLTLNGTMYIGSASGNIYATVNFGNSNITAGMLSGNGTVVFGAFDDYLYNNSNLAGASGTLTIASSITIHGNSGSIWSEYSNSGILNEGTIDADTSGGTITVNFGHFTNAGTIEATNGGSLIVSNLTGDVGVATVSGSGSTLSLGGANLVNNLGLTSLAGTILTVTGLTGNLGSVTLGGTGSNVSLGGANYVNNVGLSAPAGSTLTLNGTWTNSAGESITTNGATLNLGDQSTSSTNAWINAGTITATGSTVNLGGDITTTELGTFNRTGGTVNLVGTLNNTNSTLTLNSPTGPWNLVNGTILGGTIDDATVAGGGAVLAITGTTATLNGVTVDGDLDLSQVSNAKAIVSNGLILNGTIYLGNAAGSTSGTLVFGNTGVAAGSLIGNGTVLFGGAANDIFNNSNLTGTGGTLTIAFSITVRGKSGGLGSEQTNGSILNQGTINADVSGGTIPLLGGSFANTGIFEATNGGKLTVSNLIGNIGTANLSGAGSTMTLGGTNLVNNVGLSAPAGTTLTVTGLIGNLGTVTLGGAGTNISLNGNNYFNEVSLMAPAGSTLTLGGSWTNFAAITASGATLNLGDQSSSSGNGWNNLGAITATNSMVNLGGAVTTAELGALNCSGGTLTLVGILNNTAATLTLTSQWDVSTGTINGGIIDAGTVASGGPVLAVSGDYATLNGVSLNGDLDLSQFNNASATVSNGLVLNGTIYVGNSSGSIPGELLFGAPGLPASNLTGNGTIVLGGYTFDRCINESSGTMTIAPTITVEGGYGSIVGPIVDQGIIDADMHGNGITLNATNFVNDGMIEATNGGTLVFMNLTGNVGNAMISGTGSQLILNGTGYITNLGLAAPAGTTLTLNGTWTNPSGQSVTATGATLNLGDQSASSTNLWNNAGIINATNSTVNLGGDFVSANLGTFNHSGSTINVAGMLNNVGATLTLNASTGPWNLTGGTILGGTISAGTVAGGGTYLGLATSHGILNGVTVNGDLDLSQGNGLSFYNGLTLNGTMYLGNLSGTGAGRVFFGAPSVAAGSFTGNGTVVLGSSGINALENFSSVSGAGGTLTIGSSVEIRGSTGSIICQYNTGTILNQGTIDADVSGGTITINGAGVFSNAGNLEATNGGNIKITGSLATNNASSLLSSSTSTISISNGLYGNTQISSHYQPAGTLVLNGSGRSNSPQQFEAMSDDLGTGSAGFTNNFGYGTIELGSNTYVQLLDQSQNTSSSSAEAVYANTLIVPAGSTLNLNGLHLYTRDAQVSGTVTGGTITSIYAIYITQIYSDILHRAPDAGGMSYWTNQLKNGAPLQSVALGLSGSTEYYDGVVNSFYEQYLGRAADTPGLNYWVNQVVGGASIESIRVAITSSQEYYNDGGGTPAGYISELYQALLGRPADQGGLTNWEAVLAANGPAAVAGGFVYSLERYNVIISGYYETYLHRAADAGGLAMWANALVDGVSEQVIISDFTSSAEYLALYSIA